ncbi:antitoxin VbhA family protein [Pseudoxanthomonas winnipegensis]|jgi:hypothetical protein|uniref:Uncharacterized protein n=1 Tax=Pseudoxanthomonas winnipegensis TaxID=2480810 RepID=A0A4Q8LD50_9GAMM|nr:antitoxin VbhA family protein [Pseudoxanthomonas winnipegensis]TAA26827.1 hypothetical protein EA660_06340 [Pseudoxanthomonas winnipegensis]
MAERLDELANAIAISESEGAVMTPGMQALLGRYALGEISGSVNGEAISIGEGWAIPQAVPVLSEYINDVWEGHNQRNIDDAK